MVVVPVIQLLVFWVSDKEQKSEKVEEEDQDSSDEFLKEFLEGFLEDDEDWECHNDYFENPVSWAGVVGGWCWCRDNTLQYDDANIIALK